RLQTRNNLRRFRRDNGQIEGDPGSGHFSGVQSLHSRVTESSQKLPEISMGKIRPRGRQREIRTDCVSGPVEKDRLTGCHLVVPTVVSLIASANPPCWVSLTRKPGPLVEVMS